jgi:hypothetical protein
MPTLHAKTVKIGAPITQLPEKPRVTTPPAPYWEAVAAECRRYPGQWLPVTIDGLSEEAHRSAPSNIRKGFYFSFRVGRWDAARRDGQLYVRYLGEIATGPAPLKAVGA